MPDGKKDTKQFQVRSVSKFFEPAAALQKKLAVVLWQLPPNLKGYAQRLKVFINVPQKNKLAKTVRHAFEFRNAHGIMTKFIMCYAGETADS